MPATHYSTKPPKHPCMFHAGLEAVRHHQHRTPTIVIIDDYSGERATLELCDRCHDGFIDLMRKTYGVFPPDPHENDPVEVEDCDEVENFEDEGVKV